MEVILKDIQLFPEKSEGTIAFQAGIIIDGYNSGTVYNNGDSFPMQYLPINGKGPALITLAEDYYKKHHETRFRIPGSTNEYTFIESLDDHIFYQVARYHLMEGRRRAEKDMLQGIVWGNWRSSVRVFRFNKTIAELLQSPVALSFLKKFIQREVIPKLGPNDKILNTNLPADLLKDLTRKDPLLPKRKRRGKPPDDNTKGRQL